MQSCDTGVKSFKIINMWTMNRILCSGFKIVYWQLPKSKERFFSLFFFFLSFLLFFLNKNILLTCLLSLDVICKSHKTQLQKNVKVCYSSCSDAQTGVMHLNALHNYNKCILEEKPIFKKTCLYCVKCICDNQNIQNIVSLTFCCLTS